jgi:CubicO group peptidase (beta-lactamase class C family)
MFYDIASITKCVISTIILIEISNGNINFQDKTNDYLEYLGDFEVTLEELLSHKT